MTVLIEWNCILLLLFLQEMICNAPPLAWPWSVNAQITAATQQQMVSDPSNASPQPPPLALTKSSILSENKTNCSNSLRNKRNCAQPDNGSHTVNKRNRSSNNCNTLLFRMKQKALPKKSIFPRSNK